MLSLAVILDGCVRAYKVLPQIMRMYLERATNADETDKRNLKRFEKVGIITLHCRP